MKQRRAVLGAGMVGLLGAWIAAKGHGAPGPGACTNGELVANAAKPGDLIFMSSTSLTSRLVETLDVASDFGHVGIVDHASSGTIVLHATPDEAGGGAMRESLDSFLYTFRLQQLALFEVIGANSAQVQQALLYAHKMCDDAVPYAGDWTYDRTGPLFCTEFVWRAYHKAGIELLPGDKRWATPVSWMNAFPSQLLKSQSLREREIICG